MKEGSETKHDDDARTLPLRRGHLRVRRCGELARLLPLRELPTQYLLAGHRLLRRVAQRLPLHRQGASRLCLLARGPASLLRALRQPDGLRDRPPAPGDRSEEHTSELQSLMRSSYAVFCLKTKKQTTPNRLNV